MSFSRIFDDEALAGGKKLRASSVSLSEEAIFFGEPAQGYLARFKARLGKRTRRVCSRNISVFLGGATVVMEVFLNRRKSPRDFLFIRSLARVCMDF